MGKFEKTFDNAAVDYDKSRPMYVKEIYEDIFNYKQINQDSHVLEIGIGKGKASQPIVTGTLSQIYVSREPSRRVRRCGCKKAG